MRRREAGEPVCAATKRMISLLPCTVDVPPGYRLCLSVRGKDYEHGGPPLVLDGVKYSLTGVGTFVHVHSNDRPRDVFGGTNTLHFAPEKQPYLLLPIIPPQ
jgi:hypothetical protein